MRSICAALCSPCARADTDAINLVIDLAAKRNDEKAVTKLVEKMKADGIAINKRTVLVLRSYAAKLIPNEKARHHSLRPFLPSPSFFSHFALGQANIEKEEAKEFGELEALLKA